MVTLCYDIRLSFYVYSFPILFAPTFSSPDFCKLTLAEGSENFQPKEERSYGSIMMERVTGSKDGRVDHSLQVSKSFYDYILFDWERI